MNVGKHRVPAVTVLVGVVMLLLPALAYLQYQWLGQLSQAERERMQRTLRTAASQFAMEFDGELSKALASLQVEGTVARDENWASYAQRYSAWSENASDPQLVRDVLLVDAPPDKVNANLARVPPPPPPPPPPPAKARMFTLPAARLIAPEQLRLRRWNATAMTFEPMAWMPELLAFRDSLATRLVGFQLERTTRAGGRGGRDASVAFSPGDDSTLISPVSLVEFPGGNVPPKITFFGFTLVRLNETVVREKLLASLTSRHFHGDDAEKDYRVAVYSHDDPAKLIWESEAGAADIIANEPDVRQDFMAPRPDQMFVFARGPERDAPLEQVRTENIVVSMNHEEVHKGGTRIVVQGGGARGGGPIGARWTLLAKHRAGSLEAAVASARERNLIMSSGILLLLTVSVGLIVVSTRRAQNLARQQMEFVAAVSHELRTPVSVIGAAAGNLADGVVGDPQRVRKYGETIQGEAHRLGETVERVLQLAGIAAGRAAAGQAPVCPAGLVDDALQACKPEIDAAGFTVDLDLPMDLPMVVGDVGALRSALRNLISNAVKYGGDERWLKISVHSGVGSREPGVVTISVEDRGLGIDPEDRKHIFEPFYRGREAISRQISGSGLGLNLVQRIAEAHGGSVSVVSEPGKGSTFSLTLPAVRDQLQWSAVEAPASR
jgi:signal transduction histidine kinase